MRLKLNIGDGRHDNSEVVIAALATPEGYKGVSKSLEINSPILTVRRALLRHKVMRFSSMDVYVILLAMAITPMWAY